MPMSPSAPFFFSDTATTEIYTLSLHDALPICRHAARAQRRRQDHDAEVHHGHGGAPRRDRKSTRLNSSHTVISYAVFCLKKKKERSRGRAGYEGVSSGGGEVTRTRVAARESVH